MPIANANSKTYPAGHGSHRHPSSGPATARLARPS